MKRDNPLHKLARKHYGFDIANGNYLGPRGNHEYDTVYQGLAADEALRCAKVGDDFLNEIERRWYDLYRQQNPA